MSGKLDDRLRLELLRGRLTGLQGEAAADAVRKRLGDVEEDPLSATLHIDGQLALVDDMLHYFDRASMADSLEVRVPFLDHELVEYAAVSRPISRSTGSRASTSSSKSPAISCPTARSTSPSWVLPRVGRRLAAGSGTPRYPGLSAR